MLNYFQLFVIALCTHIGLAQELKSLNDSVLKYKSTNPKLALEFGFEGWAIVRDSGYPSKLYEGVSDPDLYALGTTLNGAYPQRMRYGGGAYNTNGDNLKAAISTQGEDVQGTKLWWAK